MRREMMLRALMVVSCCAYVGCGGESPPGVVADPPCNPGAYPAAPEGATSLLHVSAVCPTDIVDGSAAHPYPSISEALSHAEPGAAILIVPGTYAEKNLELKQDVSLIGSSSSDVTSPETAPVVLNAVFENAITVSDGASVTIRGLRLVAPKGTGVRAQGASVTIEGSSIEGVTAIGSLATTGAGVVATDDGSIILQNSAVIGAAGMGVYVANSKAIILQSTIKGSGGPGVRIDQAKDQVRIEGSTVEGSTQMGIGVFSSRAIILQSVVKGTKIDADDIGDGVLVAGSAELGLSDIEMSGNEITGNGRVGVLCAGGTRGIILQNNKIQQNGMTAAFGAGAWIQGGAGGVSGNMIEGNTFSENKFLGIGMTGETHGIILQNNMVSGTTLGETFAGITQISVGDGIGVFKGASAQIVGNTVQANGRIGLILDDAGGATTTIDQNAFEDNDQYGIILQNQPNAPSLGGNTFKGNTVGDTNTVSAGTFGVRADAFSVK